jgi:hypothetical protein
MLVRKYVEKQTLVLHSRECKIDLPVEIQYEIPQENKKRTTI